jgi:NADPH:quinone reductase-like Zn-dependent oxidoreductase
MLTKNLKERALSISRGGDSIDAVLAAFFRQHGSPEVFEIGQLAAPDVTADSVLVRVRATSVNPVDCYLRRGGLRRFAALPFPIIPGVDICGVVESTGPRVRDLQAGDEVFGFLQRGYGAYAEVVECPASWLARKPARLTDAEAASLPCVAMTALQGLRDKARLKAGDSVLIVGASGGVGTMAVQIARAMQVHVTAVCSAANADTVRALGASRVIDYSRENVFEERERFDAVFDCVGRERFWAFRRLLRPHGIHVGIAGRREMVIDSVLSRLTPGQTSYQFHVQARSRDLEHVAKMVEEGTLRPVVSRVLPLSEIAAAHRLCETRRTVGKIAVEIARPGAS